MECGYGMWGNEIKEEKKKGGSDLRRFTDLLHYVTNDELKVYKKQDRKIIQIMRQRCPFF